MPDVLRIEDADDPRIAEYRDIRERDLVGRRQKFVAEGEVVLRMLLRQQRFAPESLLIAEQRLPAVADLLASVPSGVPVYAATQAVLDRIAGFHLHRGLLGIGRRVAEPALPDLLAGLPPRATIVAAFGIANHDNVGGIFRNAAVFGADAVLLDETSCDPLYRKAIRVSVGACLTLPFIRTGSASEILDVLGKAGFEPLALSPAGSETLADIPHPGRAALLLGTEGPGLPESILRRCRTVRIPMAENFDSLNVATACAVALYELTTRRQS